MKKVNKALMATVAILLSLVLITTSVVSGIFAKFVDTKSAGATISFKKWGVTVTLTPNETQLDTVNGNHGNQSTFTATLDSTGTNASYEIKNLKLAPGDTLSKLAHFTVSGNAEVPLRVNIIIHVNFAESDFTVTTISNNTALDTEAELKKVYPSIDNAIGSCLFPVRFRTYLKRTGADKTESYVNLCNPFRADVKNGTKVETTCASILCDYLDVSKDTTVYTSDACVYKDFLTPGTQIVFHPKPADDTKAANEDIDINDFYLGFDYPITSSRPNDTKNLTEAAVNAVSTYLSQNKPNATFDVRFTVSVEQIVT